MWISLPKTWRMLTQPVAGADYWLGSKLKAFIAEQVFRVLLIDRLNDPKQAIALFVKAADLRHPQAMFNVAALIDEYDVDPDRAQRTALDFFAMLEEKGLVAWDDAG